VQNAIQREVETLLESYGTEYWDDRDVTYDNLIWGTSGIEIPIKRILFQVELAMQESVSKFTPELADVIAAELQRTLEAHEIFSRLQRATYDREYTYSLPGVSSDEPMDLDQAYKELISRVAESFRHMVQQATMYELMSADRSVHTRLEAGERELALPSSERLLDVALYGPERVRREIAEMMPAPTSSAQGAAEETAEEEEVSINILDEPAQPDFDISFLGEGGDTPSAVDLEMSYADKLDDVAVKVNRIFDHIVQDLFTDDELLPRLRRLFWLEATKAERDFNNYLVKPMLKQHDRNLYDPELRAAMEIDLESVSDLEALMRTWEGLHELETGLGI